MPSYFKIQTVLLFSLVPLVSGATLTVGPTGTFTKPCQAFAAAAAGDTILIDAAGDYRGDTCAIKPSNLLIRGINGRPKIDAMGGNALGKAIWVVQGNDVIIENVEMLNCKVPDQNGAAVRSEGLNLTLRWVYFHHNENGLLVSNFLGNVLIEFSQFAYNGYGDGYTHNIYVGHQRSLTVRFSYFHHSIVGNGVKSRADETYLYYNRIMTEHSGTGSLEIDLPNGGAATVVGNLVQQGALSQNNAMFSFTTEGGYPVNNIRMAHNTFVSQRNPSRIFSIPASFATTNSSSGLVVNNIFQGGPVVAPSYASPIITFQNNLSGDGWLADVNGYDFRLLPGSPAIDAGVETPGDLVPRWHYVHPACGTPRIATGDPDQGAYEANAPQGTAPARCGLSWHEMVPRVTLPASSVKTSGSIAARVTLDGLAPAGGAVVSLSSSNPALAAVPATVTIPAGESTVVLPIDVTVPAGGNVAFTATFQGRSAKTVLNFGTTAVAVASLTLSSSSVSGSSAATGQAALNLPAPAGGAVVALTSSNPAVVTVPASITVPAGATSGPIFNVTTKAVSTITRVTLTASYAGTTRSAVLDVLPSGLASFTVSPVTIVGGKAITAASVTLAGPAPAGGVTVLLKSNHASVVPPASVTVPAGATVSPSFAIPTSAVAVTTPVTITASFGGVSKAVTVSIKPAALYGFSTNSSLNTSGKAFLATVSLDGPAPAAGAVVTLASSLPAVAAPPASVVVAAGATVSSSFSIPAGFVPAMTSVTITASCGGVSKAVTVRVQPTAISSMNVPTTPITGGKPTTGAYLSINGPAPSGGAVVTITSSNPAVAVPPPTVTIPAGTRGPVLFSVGTSPVAATTEVTITASYAGSAKSGVLTVKPPALSSLAASPTSIKGGVVGSASVALDGPAPAGGVVVALSSSNPAAQLGASVTVPAGATVAAFPIQTRLVAVATSATVTATHGGASKAVTLTVNP